MNALLVSYHYPPMGTTGATRMGILKEYFAKQDWNLIPLTSQVPHTLPLAAVRKVLRMDGNRNLRAQVADASKRIQTPKLAAFASLYAELLLSPDPYCTWVDPAVEEGCRLINVNSCKAIVSSSPPVSAHRVAQILANAYKLPWIAELRDLWSQNHAYPYSRMRKKRDAELEVEILNSADCLVTVSRGLQQQLIDLHHRGVHCIPTGYTIRPRLKEHKNAKFTLVYTGSLYHPYQDPEPLFAALFGMGQRDMSVDFYCPSYEWLDGMVARYHLKDIVHLHPMVTHDEALLLQQKADMLLLFKWNGNAPGILTLKLWEYFGAERPILAIGSQTDDELSELLKHTDYGFTGATERHIQLVLGGALSQWKRTQYLPYSTHNWHLSQYTSAITMEYYTKLIGEACGAKARV